MDFEICFVLGTAKGFWIPEVMVNGRGIEYVP